MGEGWIKLHRKFLDWEWFEMPEMIKLFVFLLLRANHKDNKWRNIDIKRGQYLTGLKSLHKETKISVQTLRTCLKRLENTKEINMQVTNKYRIITVCNYDSYQDVQQATNKQPNKQLTGNQQASNKQVTTNKNVKKEKNEKNDKKKSKLDLTFEEFIKMRIKIRKPLTERGKELILNRLNKLTDFENEMILILEQSIENSWQGVFALKEDKANKPDQGIIAGENMRREHEESKLKS